ncbi:hypothetical protein OCGS_0757 [Oceaniovalibus guishaninsula JLT2003]|uniref:Uncharacterized protein n=2 Tax=Oceaniovalibus TaxID=1207070 RepID=K2HEY2_9RHOB|nr:hypothetical protein OCGS_0757 [Oceaniovalibus guishaninsula JLT2003]
MIERAAVLYLRAWCDGDIGRAAVKADFEHVMGKDRGRDAVSDFDDLMRLVVGQCRRPLMHHRQGCRCVGADESAFAHMIGAAAAQDRDDALLFASTLLTGHAAWSAICLAESLAQTFLCLSRSGPAPTHRPRPTDYTH